MNYKILSREVKRKALVFFIAISVSYDSFSQGTNFPPGQNAYSVQMHLHGMSNHNAGDAPGSLQWHSFLADTSETNVLWWSEHINVYKQHLHPEFTFTNGIYDSTLDAITGLNGNGSSLPIKWQMVNNGGIKNIYFNDTTLSLSITSTTPIDTLRYYTARPIGAETKLKNCQYFVRPLVSDPVFEFNLKPDNLNTTGHNKIQLTIYLDFHHYNGVSAQQKILYNFLAQPAVYSENLVDSFTVRVNVPVTPNIVNAISLNIQQSSNLLRDYTDNCTSDYVLSVYASQGDSVTAEFSKMKIHSLIPSALSNYIAINNIAKSYIVPYNVGEFVGTEYSANGHEQHINAFLADTLSNKHILYIDSNYSASDYISRIHSLNGAASYNHPFGINISFNPAFGNTEIDSFALIYLSNKFFGADILEVGYKERGGFNMQGHFSLWDKLTANSVFIYGNAASDAHGNNWYNAINHWSSFIWASDTAPENLIAGMKTGRLYGADNLIYKGRFDLHVANGNMGDRLAADTSQAPVMIDMDNVLPGSVFTYTQGLIQSGLQVNYLHFNEVMDPANPPVVDLTQPCFIRIVVYDSTGEEYLFSNPIIFSDSLGVKINEETNSILPSMKLNVVYNESTSKNEATLLSDRNQDITLEAYETNGKLVCKKKGIKVYKGKNNLTLVCSNLRPGIYLLKAFGSSGVCGATFIVPTVSPYIFECHD